MSGRWIDLAGKVALVTGGGRGIGAGIAAALTSCGATVAVCDIDGPSAEATARVTGGYGFTLDVSDADAVDEAVASVVERMGGLDILVNNAGIYRGFGGPILEMSNEVWQKLMAVNLDGVFHCSRAACRAMVNRGMGGRIVNVASTQAFTPGVGVTYDSSKAAVVQFTRTLALEMAPHGINVNAVAPGGTWVNEGPAPPVTGQPPTLSGQPLSDSVADRLQRIPLRRWGTPDEVGRVVVFLSSALSDYVTGVTVPVDGGWLLL